MVENGSKAAYPNSELGTYGLSKRELITAMAMQGLIADPRREFGAEDIAKHSVCIANAVLRELEK